MDRIDHQKFRCLVEKLYATTKELRNLTGRPFTPDGHLVGSIGEVLVAAAYGLELKKPSNEGFDAVSKDGKRVEIKATQSGKRVGFRKKGDPPDHVIVVKISLDGTFEEIYNGPEALVWEQLGEPQSNGQSSISLKSLQELNRRVADENRLGRVH